MIKENDIIALIRQDEWMMKILYTVSSLHLNDWIIGAGFVRSKVWDHLHGYKRRTPLPDIDIIYFDKNDFEKEELRSYNTKAEFQYQRQLEVLFPDTIWSVTNQARIHVFHNDSPYSSSTEALSHWVETATCVGVKLEGNDLILVAPHGIEDLANLIVRQNPIHHGDSKEFIKRIEEKEWLTKWPQLKIVL